MGKYKITWTAEFTGTYEFDDDMDVDSWAYDCTPDEELTRGDWTTTVERIE